MASGKGDPSNTYTKAAHEIEPTGAVAPGATIAVYSRLSPRALGDKFIVLGLIRHSPSKIPASLSELCDFDSIGDLVKSYFVTVSVLFLHRFCKSRYRANCAVSVIQGRVNAVVKDIAAAAARGAISLGFLLSDRIFPKQ